MDDSSPLTGETSPISVDRDDLLATAFYEILGAEQRDYDCLDIRLPLEVSFYGEGEFCTRVT